MTLRDMVDILRGKHNIEIRDRNNYKICECHSVSKGVIPYLDKEIVEWFPEVDRITQLGMFCVLINDESEE